MTAGREALPGVLNPVERFSEILFGLIMTLSFTGTLSVVSGGRQEVMTMLLSVLGCNIAWGAIDAVLYLLGAASERGSGNLLVRSIGTGGDPAMARAAIADSLPEALAEIVTADDLESFRRRLADLPPRPRARLLGARDLVGGVGVFLLVVFSCVPLIVPFLFIQDPLPALRVSNAVAIVMLFAGGYSLAAYVGTPRLLTGGVMVLLGLIMVAITIAMGG